jgi:hypothetical protein
VEEKKSDVLNLKHVKKPEPHIDPAPKIAAGKVKEKWQLKKQLFLPLIAAVLFVIGIYALSKIDWNRSEQGIAESDNSMMVDTTTVFEPTGQETEKTIKGINYVLINGGSFKMGDNLGDGNSD